MSLLLVAALVLIVIALLGAVKVGMWSLLLVLLAFALIAFASSR